MSKELKPCPFCGGELIFCPSHVEGLNIVNKPGGICRKCRMEFKGMWYRIYGEVKSEDFNNEKFFELWNTRPAEGALKYNLVQKKAALLTISMWCDRGLKDGMRKHDMNEVFLWIRKLAKEEMERNYDTDR